MANRLKVVVVLLVLIVVVLGGIMAFTFFIKPKVTGYTTQKQVQGYQIALVDIIRVTAPPNCQIFPIPVGDQQLNLVSLECLQALQAPPPQPQTETLAESTPPAEPTQ